MINLKVHGLKELQAQLKALGPELAGKALRTAARKAFKPVLAAAVARAPRPNGKTGATGATRDALRIGTAMPKAGESMLAVGLVLTGQGKKVEGPAVRKRKGLPPAHRWHFIERGTVHQAARPFLRPALDGNAEKVIGSLKVELQKSITRALKKKAGGR